MYQNTLQVIRHYLSTAVGDLIYGQCGSTGATTSIIHAPFLWQPSDYYNDHSYEVYIYRGTNAGVTKRVTDWTLSTTHLLSVHSVYGSACDATSYAELHRIFSEDEYRKAINLAIESIAPNYLIDKIDVTTTLVADVYEYTLPDGFDYVHRITTEHSADTGKFYDSNEIDPRDWDLISPRKLKLVKGYYSITATKDLRIEGQGRQATVDDDEDVIYLPPDWLVQKAITHLPENKIQSNNLSTTVARAYAWLERHPARNWPNPRARAVVE